MTLQTLPIPSAGTNNFLNILAASKGFQGILTYHKACSTCSYVFLNNYIIFVNHGFWPAWNSLCVLCMTLDSKWGRRDRVCFSNSEISSKSFLQWFLSSKLLLSLFCVFIVFLGDWRSEFYYTVLCCSCYSGFWGSDLYRIYVCFSFSF